MKRKINSIIIISIILIIIAFCVALMVGRYSISIKDFFNAMFTSDDSYNMQRKIIINLRLPRTIVASLAGIALSLSGLLYQETFQNKLVSPDLLGVSNGAGVGAALAIVLGCSSALISLFSFLGGILTVFLTLTITKAFKSKHSTMLLLSGVIMSGLMSSILSLIKYFANPDTQLSDITYWLMGSFSDVTMKNVYIMLPVVLFSSIFMLIISNSVNMVSLGQEEAQTKGLNYNLYRLIIIIVSTLLTAITVSFCGTISWIGLVIPHIVRMITGKNAIRSIPVTICFGALFMIIVDILSRTFTAAEIPLSAVTGIFGTIIFVCILIVERKSKYGH